jgi:hypothetical protein
MIYPLDQLKPKTKTKNQIFLLITFRLCYTLLKRKLFYPAVFLSPPLFKVYKKVVEFLFTPAKNILVFSF